MFYILSFSTGIIIVVGVMLNAQASKKAGAFNGIIINYLTASITSIILCLLISNDLLTPLTLINIPPIYYVCGMIGVLTTFLFNIIVPHVPSFQVVVLRFIGQMLTSAILDYLFLHLFSKGKIIGGFIFLIGLVINARIDKNAESQEAEKL